MSASTQAPRRTAGHGLLRRFAPMIVAAVGAVLIVAAIGLVLRKADIGITSGDPAQPTAMAAQRDLGEAATTLTPSAAGALIDDAQRCRSFLS